MSTDAETKDLIYLAKIAGESPAPDDRGHRIRQALRLANGPLPNVDTETLGKYYRYLIACLSFPFQARYHEEVGFLREKTHTVTVLHALDPSGNIKDDFGGVYCEIRMDGHTRQVSLAELEVQEDNANYQLLEDYWHWFWNWQ